MLDFEIIQYIRDEAVCYNTAIPDFKYFFHFSIEKNSSIIHSKYFENSNYSNDVNINFTVKTKKGAKVGTKREIDEVDDIVLNSINNLGKRMKRMEAEYYRPRIISDEESNIVIFPEETEANESINQPTLSESTQVIAFDESIFDQRKQSKTKATQVNSFDESSRNENLNLSIQSNANIGYEPNTSEKSTKKKNENSKKPKNNLKLGDSKKLENSKSILNLENPRKLEKLKKQKNSQNTKIERKSRKVKCVIET